MSTHLNHKGEACRRVWFAKATDGVGGYLNANGDVGPCGHVLSGNRAEAEAACLAYVSKPKRTVTDKDKRLQARFGIPLRAARTAEIGYALVPV